MCDTLRRRACPVVSTTFLLEHLAPRPTRFGRLFSRRPDDDGTWRGHTESTLSHPTRYLAQFPSGQTQSNPVSALSAWFVLTWRCCRYERAFCDRPADLKEAAIVTGNPVVQDGAQGTFSIPAISLRSLPYRAPSCRCWLSPLAHSPFRPHPFPQRVPWFALPCLACFAKIKP